MKVTITKLLAVLTLAANMGSTASLALLSPITMAGALLALSAEVSAGANFCNEGPACIEYTAQADAKTDTGTVAAQFAVKQAGSEKQPFAGEIMLQGMSDSGGAIQGSISKQIHSSGGDTISLGVQGSVPIGNTGANVMAAASKNILPGGIDTNSFSVHGSIPVGQGAQVGAGASKQVYPGGSVNTFSVQGSVPVSGGSVGGSASINTGGFKGSSLGVQGSIPLGNTGGMFGARAGANFLPGGHANPYIGLGFNLPIH